MDVAALVVDVAAVTSGAITVTGKVDLAPIPPTGVAPTRVESGVMVRKQASQQQVITLMEVGGITILPMILMGITMAYGVSPVVTAAGIITLGHVKEVAMAVGIMLTRKERRVVMVVEIQLVVGFLLVLAAVAMLVVVGGER